MSLENSILKIRYVFFVIKGMLSILFQFGWLVGDNISVNDVAARYVSKELKPRARKLNAKEIRGRYVIQFYYDNVVLTIHELK